MVANTQLVTAEELLDMPDDGFKYELVRGELKKMAPAGSEHSISGIQIGAALFNHVKANNLGRVFGANAGFLLAKDPDTVRAPDAAFVRRERVEAVGKVTGYWPGPPDLAVEIVSPTTAIPKFTRRWTGGWRPGPVWWWWSTPETAPLRFG